MRRAAVWVFFLAATVVAVVAVTGWDSGPVVPLLRWFAWALRLAPEVMAS